MRYRTYLFPQRLAEARKSRGLTRVKLGERLGLSETKSSDNLRNWERGLRVPSAETAAKLAQALDVSLDWLMGGEIEEQQDNGAHQRYRMSLLPERLKSRREERGLTQDQLTEMIKAGHGSVLKYEIGKRMPSLSTTIDLALALRVSVDWLCGCKDLKENRE